jgi:hypothetical protein
MSRRDHLCANAPTSSVEFSFGQLTILRFPLGDGAKTVPNQQGTSRRGGHPRRDADTVVCRRGEDLRMYVRSNGDGQLR